MNIRPLQDRIMLDDGPRLTAQIVDCKPKDVEIGIFYKLK